MMQRNGTALDRSSRKRRALHGLRAVALAAGILVALMGGLRAQGPLSQWRKLTPPVRRWTVLHPFAARRAQQVTQQVLAITDSVRATGQLGDRLEGGRLDAFRHMLWMALLVRRMSPRKALALGRAYERGNYWMFRHGQLEDGSQQDSSSSVMDLGNNAVGCDWGLEMRDWPTAKVAPWIISQIKLTSYYYYIDSVLPAGAPRRWNNQREVSPPGTDF